MGGGQGRKRWWVGEPCVSPLEWEAEVASLNTREAWHCARPLSAVLMAAVNP